MYSLEERTKAIKLYIEADCNESTVIRTLGYPSPNALRNWYTEYLSNGKLHATSAPKPRYTEQQKAAAVAYFATHRTTLTQTCRAMGYPCRNKLRQWILETRPELLEKAKKPCIKENGLVRCSQEQKWAAVETMLIDGLPAYKVAAQYGVSKTTIFNWKRQMLERNGIASMKIEMDTVQTDKTTSELESEIESLKLQIKHLQMERDALEKATELLKKVGGINLTNLKNTEKAEVIDALRPTYRLKELLQLFNISKSSYFYSAHAAMHDKYAEIRPEITELFRQNELRYGYRRIHACLKRRGKTLSEKVIRRIMRQESLTVYVPVRKKYSSYKGEISPEVSNVLQRDFHASAPNQKWLTDLTEFALPAGKVYLSPVIDCFDGLVCSWTIGSSPNAQLVNSMLDKAWSPYSQVSIQLSTQTVVVIIAGQTGSNV